MATRYKNRNVDTDQGPVSHLYDDLLTSRPGRGRGRPVTAECVSNSCRLDMSTEYSVIVNIAFVQYQYTLLRAIALVIRDNSLHPIVHWPTSKVR